MFEHENEQKCPKEQNEGKQATKTTHFVYNERCFWQRDLAIVSLYPSNGYTVRVMTTIIIPNDCKNIQMPMFV